MAHRSFRNGRRIAGKLTEVTHSGYRCVPHKLKISPTAPSRYRFRHTFPLFSRHGRTSIPDRPTSHLAKIAGLLPIFPLARTTAATSHVRLSLQGGR